MKAHILLINRGLTYVNQPQIVQGINGERIGVSQFDPPRSCHTLKLAPADYEKHAQTIIGTAHLAMQKWEPHFVVEPVPPAVKDFEDGYELAMDRCACPEGKSAYFRQGFAAANSSAYLCNTESIASEVTKNASENVETTEVLKNIEVVWDKPEAGRREIVIPASIPEEIRFDSPSYSPAALEGTHPTDTIDPDAAFMSETIPFFKLQKLAKAEGLDPAIFEDTRQMKAAILTKRKSKLQPA